MGPKLMNCCKPETEEHQRIWQNAEENSNSGRRQSPSQGGKKLEDRRTKEKNHKKGYQMLVEKFEMEGFMAQKGVWNLDREKVLRERGELPKEEGDAVREYKAMHEENFMSSWFGEEVREKEEIMVKVSDEKEEERSEKREREGEKEEDETETVKRRCEGFVSVEALENFCQERDLESCGHLSKGNLLDRPEDLPDGERFGWLCLICLMCLMCLFLLLSLSFVMVSLVARIGNLWSRSPFSFSKRAFALLYSCAGRDEV